MSGLLAHESVCGFCCSNLYTLEGGVHNYLRQEGADLWNGSLFVFDGRMAVASPGAPHTKRACTVFSSSSPCRTGQAGHCHAAFCPRRSTDALDAIAYARSTAH